MVSYLCNTGLADTDDDDDDDDIIMNELRRIVPFSRFLSCLVIKHRQMRVFKYELMHSHTRGITFQYFLHFN